MGNKHSLEDDLITFKLTSKQFGRDAKKCDKNEITQKMKLKKAIEQGNMEGARIYAQNAIREKNSSLNFLRLGSRVDAVAARLESAIRMQQVSKLMGTTVKSMSSAMKGMEVEQIAKTMTEFERQFENMDVRSAYMEDAMETTTCMATPPEQVDSLIHMVADEHGLQLGGMMDGVGTVGSTINIEPIKTAPSTDLDSRLAALRK